jgi:hypothetical protein
MEVEAGYGGRYLPGRRLPVRVTLRADQLMRGRIEVTIRDQAGSYSTPVEVPGGSEKRVLLVVPTPTSFPIRDVSVRLLVGDQSLGVQTTVTEADDQQLVGLLPAVTPADLPGVLTLPMEAGTARFVALDTDTVATAGALDPIGTVAGGTDELRRLDAGSSSTGSSGAAAWCSTPRPAPPSRACPTSGSPAPPAGSPPVWARSASSPAPSPRSAGPRSSSPRPR